jgi:hypothetical protein
VKANLSTAELKADRVGVDQCSKTNWFDFAKAAKSENAQKCAVEAAPYIRPRLQSIAVKPGREAPIE